MTAPRILAIDQGTTSTRAVMFDAQGSPLAISQLALRQVYPADGWVEHDPEEIWAATLTVCRAVIDKTGGSVGIAALGITNQRETTALWNRRTGLPLMNAIVWQDRRGAPLCAALRDAGHISDADYEALKIKILFE